MSIYILTITVASVMLLIAALISIKIPFKGGNNPPDPKQRRIVFWIFAFLTLVINSVVGIFVFAPNPLVSIIAYNKYNERLLIASGVAFILFIILGFVLSRIFRNGKLGNWF